MSKLSMNPKLAVVDLLMEYGCQKTGTQFEIGFECRKNGIINVDKGNLWINKVSKEMRKFCRDSISGRKLKNLSNKERELYYITYLKKKPYFRSIENYMKFDYRSAGSDYVGISLSAGVGQLVSILKYELQ